MRSSSGADRAWEGAPTVSGASFHGHDIIFDAAIASVASRGLLNADLIRKMRPTSYLVSVSRAEITDRRAIRSALQENRLAGAALDDFESEPLRIY